MSADREARECRVFTRYLVGADPTPYVVEKYAEGQRRHSGFGGGPRRFERLLVGFARCHPLTARLADGYARLFEPRCLLRKKLVLLLAILESAAPFSRRLDAASGRGALLVAGLAARVAGAALAALVGSLLLLPLRALVALVDGGRS